LPWGVGRQTAVPGPPEARAETTTAVAVVVAVAVEAAVKTKTAQLSRKVKRPCRKAWAF